MSLGITEIVFYAYIFISLYMLSLMAIIYIRGRKEIYSYPKGKVAPVSIVVPCYNEGERIGKSIEALLSLNWSKDMLEIIVVDDKSNDNSVEVARRYAKKYDNVRVIVNKRNSGGAAEPTNLGVKAARFDYIAVADADSTPDRDALIKMIGFLQEDPRVGGVTCVVAGKHRNMFIEKLQAIEYAVIAFSRKLLDRIDSVYVTPGPFALYKKKVLLEVGLFDTKNMTQDIEIVWRMLKHGYIARMCLATSVHSVTPITFKGWFKQRQRWNIGGMQTISKYRGFFLRKGMLGAFVLPFFVMSWIIGLVGIGLFVYLFSRRFLITYLSTKLSLYAGTEVIKFNELNLNLSVLNFFGIAMFILGALFSFIGLGVMQEKELRNRNPWSSFVYLTLYMTFYPLVLITSVYKFYRGNYSW